MFRVQVDPLESEMKTLGVLTVHAPPEIFAHVMQAHADATAAGRESDAVDMEHLDTRAAFRFPCLWCSRGKENGCCCLCDGTAGPCSRNPQTSTGLFVGFPLLIPLGISTKIILLLICCLFPVFFRFSDRLFRAHMYTLQQGSYSPFYRTFYPGFVIRIANVVLG